MQLAETMSLVKHVCSVEGRQATPETASAWHPLLEGLDYEVASKAAMLALADHNIFQVAPKHVLAKVPAAVAELNAALRKAGLAEDLWKAEPQPICKGHRLPTTTCDDCCAVLRHQVGHLHGDELHRWACANLYEPSSLVENQASL